MIPSTLWLTLTVGLPASGKSTWALQGDFAVAISLDDCREDLWGGYSLQDGPGGVGAVLAHQERKIQKGLEQRQTIVVHNTNHVQEYRQPVIQLAHEYGYKVRLVYFDVDFVECQRRNLLRKKPVPEEIMLMFSETMEIPTKNEADEVVLFSEIG